MRQRNVNLLLFIPLVHSTPVSEVYMVKSFVTPVVPISPVESLQPGSEKSLKEEEEGGAPSLSRYLEEHKVYSNEPASEQTP